MKKLFLLTAVLIFSSCCRDFDKDFRVLKPEINITTRCLLKNGFKGYPESEIIYVKKIGDTTVHFIMRDEGFSSKPAVRWCQYKLNTLDLDSIKSDFWSRGNFRIYAPIDESEEGFILFFVRDHFKNYFFKGDIDKNDSTITLTYDYLCIDC